MGIMKNLTSTIFDEEYERYVEECKGISFMAPSSSFGLGGIEGAYRTRCLEMVLRILDRLKE